MVFSPNQKDIASFLEDTGLHKKLLSQGYNRHPNTTIFPTQDQKSACQYRLDVQNAPGPDFINLQIQHSPTQSKGGAGAKTPFYNATLRSTVAILLVSSNLKAQNAEDDKVIVSLICDGLFRSFTDTYLENTSNDALEHVKYRLLGNRELEKVGIDGKAKSWESPGAGTSISAGAAADAGSGGSGGRSNKGSRALGKGDSLKRKD